MDLKISKKHNFSINYKLYTFLCILFLCTYSVFAQSYIRSDVPLKLYRCSLACQGSTIEKGQVIDVFFCLENYRKKTSPKIEFGIIVPQHVFVLYGDGRHMIDETKYRQTSGVTYKIKVDNEYPGMSVPIEVWMTNDNGDYVPCYQATIEIGQSELFANIIPITESRLVLDETIKEASDEKIDTTPTLLTNRYRVVVGTKLNVRQSPSPRAKVIGTLLDGDYVEVYKIENHWAEIEFNQKHAFIAASYIEIAPIQKKEEVNKENLEEKNIDKPIVVDTLMIVQDEIVQEKRKGNVDIIISMATGLSNLYSTDAYSEGTIGVLAESGIRFRPKFMSNKLFAEATIGFAALGNSNYLFPCFAVNILPLGINHNIFNHPFHAQFGLSLLLGGNDISVDRYSFRRTYYAVPTINVVIKEAIEVGKHWDFGLLYFHGLNNVCENLPIRLVHSSIQIFATYKFIIK